MANGVRKLITRLNDWTDIKPTVGRGVAFDSAELLQTPWVFLSVVFGLDPAESEIENLGKYLLNGGFFMFEGGNWRGAQGERQIKQFVESALASQGQLKGRDCEYRFLPSSHHILHSYHDLPDGTRVGYMMSIHLYGISGEDGALDPWSKGIEINGRLVALNSNQACLICWIDWGPKGLYRGAVKNRSDPTLQSKFGINTIIFALTQEGSITKRVIDMVR